MTTFTRVGKQVLANGFHYADAADETAAQFILAALINAVAPTQTTAVAPLPGRLSGLPYWRLTHGL